MQNTRARWIGAAVAAGLLVGAPGAALAQSLTIDVPPGVYPSPGAYWNEVGPGYGYRAYGEDVAAPRAWGYAPHHGRRIVRHESRRSVTSGSHSDQER